MVFENLTLVELHVDDARFGPAMGDDEPAEAGSGPRAFVGLLLLALLALGGAAAYRRFAAVEGDDESGDGISIEAAAEQ